MSDASGPVLLIHCQHIQQNFRFLCDFFTPSKIGCVVKANSYGIGFPITKILADAGCKIFFVATPEEGQEVRTYVGKQATVYVLHGLTQQDLQHYHDAHLIPILSTYRMLERWGQEAKKQGHPLPAILQIDTGMHRLGLDEKDIIQAKKAGWESLLNIHYLMSHLAFGRIHDHPENKKQSAQLLRQQQNYFPEIPLTLTASGAMVLPQSMHHQLVRVGLSLYGAFSPNKLPDNPLHFPLNLKARVLQIKEIPPNQGVGYGLTDKSTKARRLATVAIGYADGLSQTLSHKNCCFYYKKTPLPIVGIISMDLTIIDVTSLQENACQELDWVDVFYDNVSLYNLAKAAGSSQHEILAGLGKRVIRDYQ